MTRRNLLKSLLNSVLSAPFLPLVWREKAEVPVAEPVVEPVDPAWSANVPCPELNYSTIADQIERMKSDSVWLYRIEGGEYKRVSFPVRVEPGEEYYFLACSEGTGNHQNLCGSNPPKFGL